MSIAEANFFSTPDMLWNSSLTGQRCHLGDERVADGNVSVDGGGDKDIARRVHRHHLQVLHSATQEVTRNREPEKTSVLFLLWRVLL